MTDAWHIRAPLLAGTALISFVYSTVPATALDCPEPQAAASAGVIEDPQKEIQEISGLLASGDVESRIEKIVTNFRGRYPNLDTASLVNVFVTAYCPVVDAEGIDEGAKKAKMGRFSSQVYAIATQ